MIAKYPADLINAVSYPPAGRPPRPSTGNSRSTLPRRRLAILLAMSVLALLRGYLILHTAGDSVSRQSASATALSLCSPPPQPGASPAASAYVRAIAAATPAWRNIDATLTAEGLMTHHDDLLNQINADAPFLTSLRAITFPAQTATAAQNLINAIQSYDDFLKTAFAHHGYFAQHSAEATKLNETRAEDSAGLRGMLSLPPSQCAFKRP